MDFISTFITLEMPHCDYCYGIDHTIRTCRDPSIKAELNKYFAYWIAPDLILANITFTYLRRRVLWIQINSESLQEPNRIRAISIHYCRQRHNASIAAHVDSIVDRIVAEAVLVNQLDEEQREEWCMEVTGMSILDWQDHINEIVEEIDADEIVEEIDADEIDEEIAVDEIDEEIDADEPKKYPVYDIILKTDAEPTDCYQECAICQEEKPANRFDKTQCSHSFCQECISMHLESKRYNRASCPLCRTEITSLETTDQQCYESLYSCFSETGALMKDCLHMWGLE